VSKSSPQNKETVADNYLLSRKDKLVARDHVLFGAIEKFAISKRFFARGTSCRFDIAPSLNDFDVRLRMSLRAILAHLFQAKFTKTTLVINLCKTHSSMKIAALNQRVEAVENLYSKVVDIHD